MIEPDGTHYQRNYVQQRSPFHKKKHIRNTVIDPDGTRHQQNYIQQVENDPFFISAGRKKRVRQKITTETDGTKHILRNVQVQQKGSDLFGQIPRRKRHIEHTIISQDGTKHSHRILYKQNRPKKRVCYFCTYGSLSFGPVF